MAHAGQVIDSPVSGEQVVFNATSEDTGGETWRSSCAWRRTARSRGCTCTPEQEERFEVLEGRMRFRMIGFRKRRPPTPHPA